MQDELMELEDQGHGSTVEDIASMLDYLPGIVRAQPTPMKAKTALLEICEALVKSTQEKRPSELATSIPETVEMLYTKLLEDKETQEQLRQVKRADQELKRHHNAQADGETRPFKKREALRKEKVVIRRLLDGGMSYDKVADYFNRRYARELSSNSLAMFSRNEVWGIAKED